MRQLCKAMVVSVLSRVAVLAIWRTTCSLSCTPFAARSSPRAVARAERVSGGVVCCSRPSCEEGVVACSGGRQRSVARCAVCAAWEPGGPPAPDGAEPDAATEGEPAHALLRAEAADQGPAGEGSSPGPSSTPRALRVGDGCDPLRNRTFNFGRAL